MRQKVDSRFVEGLGMILDPLISCNSTIAYQIHRLSKRILMLYLLFFLPGSGFAQSLTLFEEIETRTGTSAEGSSRAMRRDSNGNEITGPEFTLIGTTRIGLNSLVVVEDRLGKIISISVCEGTSATIPAYPGFEVVAVSGGGVAIKFPNDLPCVEFRERGVGCEGTGLARLVLTNAEPLEGVTRSMTLSQESGTELIDEESTTNPFEALLQRAANSDSDVDETAFEPTRINPTDVPPGMRIVSTPFGDRLVEEE